MPESENETRKTLTIPQIREAAVLLNSTARHRPPTTLQDFEDNRQALVSLVVELCDRNTELTAAAGAMTKRLTEEVSTLHGRITVLEEQFGGIVAAIQQASGQTIGTQPVDQPATEADLAQQFAQAQTDLEAQGTPKPTTPPATTPPAAKPVAKGNGSKKPSPVATTVAQPTVAPTPPAPPPVADAAATAAAMNGAQGTPSAMAIMKQG